MAEGRKIAIIGAGVSGLTCGVAFAAAGFRTEIFAAETGDRTTSAAAAAIWYPYDAQPVAAVIAWSLRTYEKLRALAAEQRSGVTMIQLRQFARVGHPRIPEWALTLGAEPVVPSEVEGSREFNSGFALAVPLTDTSIYLEYLADRFRAAGGRIHDGVQFQRLADAPVNFDTIVNCSGVGARTLAGDANLEPHRGQVVIVPKLDLPYALVCDDPPLMYAIPRATDCVFGGTNEISDDLRPNAEHTRAIVTECSRALGMARPQVIAVRVGLRPFRSSGVRVEAEQLSDGRKVIHNYGHGGSGFTLSWGCAEAVLRLARTKHPQSS